MAFFFSAISAQGPPKGKGKKQASAPDPQSDDSNDEVVTPSQVASNASPVWLSNHSTVVDEKLRPTINYWIALTTPNGAPANPIFIHRALLDCDEDNVTIELLSTFLANNRGQIIRRVMFITPLKRGIVNKIARIINF